jgi:predicted dehydrogenase
VHASTDRPIWPQGIDRPADTPPVPRNLHWDLWLGPAPERPYHPAYHPFNWRGWWDFGTGAIGDMACHTMNLPFMALNLEAPSAVSAVSNTPVNNETAPMGCIVTYEFPARGNQPALTMKWYERNLPPRELFHGRNPSGSGCLIVGANGTLYSPSDYGGSYVLLPTERFQNYQPPAPTLPRVPGENHHREWLNSIRGGQPAMSNFVDYAAKLTETALLGNVAIRVGERFTWNAETLTASVPAAAQYIRREYRRGWDIEPATATARPNS